VNNLVSKSVEVDGVKCYSIDGRICKPVGTKFSCEGGPPMQLKQIKQIIASEVDQVIGIEEPEREGTWSTPDPCALIVNLFCGIELDPDLVIDTLDKLGYTLNEVDGETLIRKPDIEKAARELNRIENLRN